MSNGGSDGILVEVERSLDSFLATHAHSASLLHLDKLPPLTSSCGWKRFDGAKQCSARGEVGFHRDLAQLQRMCAFASSRALDPIVQRLLKWIEAVERRPVASAPPLASTSPATTPAISVFRQSFGSWLIARLLVEVFDAVELPVAGAETDQVASTMLDRCFRVFEIEHQTELKRSQHGSGGFFSAFMSSVPALKPSSHFSSSSMPSARDPGSGCDARIHRHALGQWRLVLGRAARLSPRITRAKLQRELSKPELAANVPKTSIPALSPFHGDPIGAVIPHPYLQFLSELPLGLADGASNSGQRLKDAALLLKLFVPLLGKSFKARARRGAAALVASLLHRERRAMDRERFKTLLALAPVSEWNSSVSELHAIALKLSQKRKTLAAGWELRASVLALAPSDIFGRYWKDDMHALLRLQYRHSKDGGGIGIGNVSGSNGAASDVSAVDSVGGTVLRCVGMSFTNFMMRHLLDERRGGSPSESDCMEMINTAQAWCFFSSHRQKSFARFHNSVLPVLVELSVAIAAFNMRYAIQSHLRRLLTEADSVVDDKKLVGLTVLLELCRNCTASDPSSDADTVVKPLDFSLDAQTFRGQLRTLGEISGHVLILCDTLLGHDLLFDQLASMASTPLSASLTADQANASSAATRLLRDENKRSLAIEIFATALRALEFVYNDLELRSDQKVLLLVRASVHADSIIRASAAKTLLAVAASAKFAQAGAILRGLTDYLVRMASNHALANDAEPLKLLVLLCESLLRAATDASFSLGEYSATTTCWEEGSIVRESFLQVEAAAVFLLTHNASVVRLAAAETLETVRELRATITTNSELRSEAEPGMVESVSALDVIATLEPALKGRFFTFRSVATRNEAVSSKKGLDVDGLWHFRCLAGDWGDTKHAFRWSMCLATVFPALATELPQLMTYFWTDANDKVSKLEPVIATSNDGHISRFGSSDGDISRWRNLSIFATASACRTLVLATPSTASKPSSILVNAFSSSSPTAQSAISSSAVAALLKCLARYLKSVSMEQQKAAIVALGATHRSSHALLIDVLSKCEADAFFDTSQDQLSMGKSSSRTDSFETLVRPVMQQSSVGTALSGSASRRYSKSAAKAKGYRSTIQLQTQWAISRCYRLLLEGVFSSSSDRLASTSDDGSESLGSDKKATEATSSMNEDELLLSAAASFLVRMANALDMHSSGAVNGDRTTRGMAALLAETGGHMLFMIQQDFCGAVQLLLKHLMMLDRCTPRALGDNNHEDGNSASDVEERPEQHETATESGVIGSFVNEARAAQWVKTLLGWCASFGSLADATMGEHLDGTFFAASSPLYDAWINSCDVFGVRERESGQTLPWMWLDEAIPTCIKRSANQDSNSRRQVHPSAPAVASSTRFLRFFTCHCAFSTLTTLIDSSRHQFVAADLATSSSPILSWLDECFAVDITRSAAHFTSLQEICQAAAKRLLDIDCDGAFRSICIEKSCFRRSSGVGHVVAKQYMLALSTQARRISVELQAASKNSSGSTTSGPTNEVLCSTTSRTTGICMHFLYSLLLHLGATAGPSDSSANDLHRTKVLSFVSAALPRDHLESEQASRWLGSLAVSAPHYSTVLASEVRNRIQVAAASALASSFPGLRFSVCVAVFRHLDRCDVFIQRSMLGAVLPLLVDTKAPELPSDSVGRATEPTTTSDYASFGVLLELMFKLTMSISDACAEQLDRVWLTLAYSSTSTPLKANLLVIVAFLVKKCESPAQTATAKLILWWLARWQDAAFNVMSVLCAYIETQRMGKMFSTEEHCEDASGALTSAAATAKSASLDGTATLVSLASDASCHLQQSHAKAFKEVVLQAVHFSLLLIFVTPATLESSDTTSCFTTSTRARARPLPLAGSDREPQLEEGQVTTAQLGSNVSGDIRRDCVVLLQTMTQFLTGATTQDALANAMNAITSCVDNQTAHKSSAVELSTDACRATGTSESSDVDQRVLFRGLLSLAQNLSREDAAVWSELCVKEVALVLSSATGSPPASKLTASATTEARFAVIVYRSLTPSFNGDVFLAVLELLHVALDEHHNPAAYEPLICDCLALLARMVECMPDSKLALYPQVLWVCTALLNHFSTPSAQESTLALLYALLHKPMLVASEVLADVVICKRPAQWSLEQSSVLRALVSSLHIGAQNARGMAINMIAQCILLLPRTLLMVTEVERAVLCSVGLLPVLAARSSQLSGRFASAELLENACYDLAAQWEALVAQVGSAAGLNDAKACHVEHEAMLNLARYFQDRAKHHKHLPDRSGAESVRATPVRSSMKGLLGSESTSTEAPQEAISSFVRVYLPALAVVKRRSKPSVDGLVLTFDVIARTLTSIGANSLPEASSSSSDDDDIAFMSEMDASAFVLAEELLLTMEATAVQWRPPSSFVAALTQIVRQPQRKLAWQAAVRLLTYLTVESNSVHARHRGINACSSCTRHSECEGHGH